MLSVDGTYQLGRGAAGQPVFVMGNGRAGHGPPGLGGGGADAEADLDLYNPVYEELSGSRAGSEDEEEDESDCGRARRPGRRSPTRTGPASEDEFAEDELSVGEAGEAEADRQAGRGAGSAGLDLGRDVDSSDADDRRG